MTAAGRLRAPRSVFGTIFSTRLDWSGFSLKSGWNSMEAFGKRVGGLAAFVLVAASLFPIWTPGQSRLEYQLNENTRQLQALSSVPTDIAIIKERLAAMEVRARENAEGIAQIRTAAFMGAFGMLSWMAVQLFTFFGGKTRRQQQ